VQIALYIKGRMVNNIFFIRSAFIHRTVLN
jgi:hypothetical protein